MKQEQDKKYISKAKARELWFKALESGEYQQTTKTLQDELGYCCLGVLCRVYEKHMGSVLNEEISLITGQKTTLKGGDLDEQPNGVKDWVGLRNGQGLPYNGNEDAVTFSCVNLNDTKRLTFPEIAAYLRSNEKYYFED